MRLYHITSPGAAVSIVRTGRFYAAGTTPLNNDNGLNCLAFRVGYRLDQHFEGVGANVILEWTGPTSVTSQDAYPPLAVDVLHDQFPWRCFIRGGSNATYLRVVRIKFAKGEVDTLLELPSWYGYLPQKIKRSLIRRDKLGLLRWLRSRYIAQPLMLTVID